MCKSQTPKPVLGQTLKFDPPLFFQNWFGPEEPRRRLGHGKSTNGQLAHSMAPRGGQSTSGPSQGQFIRGPSREQSASGPSWGVVLLNSRGNSRLRWEDGSLRRHHLPLERHGRRPRRLSWEIPLLRVCQAVGLSPWALRGHASLRAMVSCIDIGSGAMRQQQSECST